MGDVLQCNHCDGFVSEADIDDASFDQCPLCTVWTSFDEVDDVVEASGRTNWRDEMPDDFWDDECWVCRKCGEPAEDVDNPDYHECDACGFCGNLEHGE